MARLFGTDGIRGIANADLSCDLAFKIGSAGALILTSVAHKPRILIGRDTRISGKLLQHALTVGICSVGAEAVDVGVITTPGIAHLVREHDADAAVMISASHNSFEYNGIKWFNGGGYKLSDELEDQIEELILSGEMPISLPVGEDIGISVRASNSAQEYIQYLVSCCDSDISNMTIALDCANGAASAIAPQVFTQLGAKVIACYNQPDGCNINAHCGSTHPERLQRIVVENGADVGFAFDGDADRLIAVDEFGVLVDGDRVMAMCAIDFNEKGKLKNNTLVATVMSNLGMKTSLKERGINVVETNVGDRYVLERMLEDGYSLGGEQSGHVIFLDKNTTGDGILSAIELLAVMVERKEKLSDLARMIKIYPQVLINVRVTDEVRENWQDNEVVSARIAQAEEKLGDKGRVLVRASGTEPLLRIMLEGESKKEIETEAVGIAQAMISELGAVLKK